MLLVELVVDSDDQNGHGCVTYISTEGSLMANNVPLPYNMPQYIKREDERSLTPVISQNILVTCTMGSQDMFMPAEMPSQVVQ